MNRITLDELDEVGHTLELTNNVAESLAGTGLVEVRYVGSSRWKVLPRKRIGAARVGNLQVQVVPKRKVALSRVLFLLGYANDPGFLDSKILDVTAEEMPDLLPALAESVARLTERALLHGVLQGYRTINETARTVRGRIRISDQLSRRPGLFLPIEVTYDDYTVDTAENRIIRAALRRMIAVPGLDRDIRARLIHLDSRLEGVTLIRSRAPLPSWSPSRLNIRYQPALRLAEVVLRNSSAEAGPGSTHVAAFVVEMWRVFEDFVTGAIRESFKQRYPGRTVAQYPQVLDEPTAVGSRIKMSIDIVHLIDNAPQLVFDAKYKVASVNGSYTNADHYQMLAYCTALKVPTAWLVYAGGAEKPRHRRIRNTSITIVEYPLDLSSQPRELIAQIDRLTNYAWHSARNQTRPDQLTIEFRR